MSSRRGNDNEVYRAVSVKDTDGDEEEELPVAKVVNAPEDLEMGQLTAPSQLKVQGREVSNAPPPGVPAGGVWGTGRYDGGNTVCLEASCCCAFGLIGFCCAKGITRSNNYLDERDVYMLDSVVYDEDGQCLGNQADFKPNQKPFSRRFKAGLPKSFWEDNFGPNYRTIIWTIVFVLFVYVPFIILAKLTFFKPCAHPFVLNLLFLLEFSRPCVSP